LRRIDRLGVLLNLIGITALSFLPFIVFKANRIVPGEPRSLLNILPPAVVWGFYACLVVAGVTALLARDPRWRLAVALLALGVVALALGAAANALTPPGNLVVRAAPGGAFWITSIALGLLATDALTRLELRPSSRLMCLVLFLAVLLAALGSGYFDHLSIMREYATNAPRFAREAGQHVLLALGSLTAAVLVALPLGVFCHRQPRLRGALLGLLNMVQTVPSIALFGILMAPLGAVAAAFPMLANIGVRGIGTAPAVVALFLYSLLPIVANTVVGLGRVAPAAVDAAS